MLAAGTLFTVTLSGLTDIAGNALPLTTWSFTTGAAQDTTPPQILLTNPADQQTGVATNAAIVIDFDKPISPTTVNATTIAVTAQPSGVFLDGVLALDNSSGAGVVTFTPQSSFPSNTNVNVAVNGVADLRQGM